MAIIRIQGSEEKSAHIYYEVNSEEKELGTGGMGQVRRGIRVDEKTGIRTEVAIKFLFDDLPPSTIERARREAAIRLHNDNLVEMMGFIESEENGIKRYHVVSELLHGVMLFDLLKGNITDSEGKPVEYARTLMEMRISNPERFAMTIMKNVLTGVMALHDSGHVHRDIDPSNIMITSSGKIKLLDFGIAKRLNTLNTQDQQFTTTGVFMGKAAYAAPELVLGDVANQNETTDIYALGILLYQLLTGHQPFEGAANEVMEMQCKAKMPLKEIRNKNLRKIVGKATEKKQSERYRTVSAMRVALEEAELSSDKKGVPSTERVFTSSGEQTPVSQTSTITKSLSSSKRKFPIWLVAVVGIVMIAGIVCALYLSRSGEEENQLTQEEISRAIADSIAREEAAAIASLSWTERLKSNATQSELLSQLKSASEELSSSGAEAAYLYGGLIAHQERIVDKEIISLYTDTMPIDLSAAHSLYEKSFQADSTYYKSIYELGYDYAMGTGVDIDLEKAAEMMKKGLSLAKKAGDKEYENLFQTAIEKIGL